MARRKACPVCGDLITPGRWMSKHINARHPGWEPPAVNNKPGAMVLDRETLQHQVVQAVREERIGTARALVKVIDSLQEENV